MKVIDVGSGTPSRYRKYLEGDKIVHVDINRTAFHLEVICDINHLPFKESSFQVAHASHVLEHLYNPIQAIKELSRISSDVVILRIPNAGFYKWKNLCPDHIYGWDQYTFENFLKKVFREVKIAGSCRRIERGFLKELGMAILRIFYDQDELTAVCRK
jgi:ubiquinone/menaquinone biosynthesis C-methylase UbiE